MGIKLADALRGAMALGTGALQGATYAREYKDKKSAVDREQQHREDQDANEARYRASQLDLLRAQNEREIAEELRKKTEFEYKAASALPPDVIKDQALKMFDAELGSVNRRNVDAPRGGSGGGGDVGGIPTGTMGLPTGVLTARQTDLRNEADAAADQGRALQAQKADIIKAGGSKERLTPILAEYDRQIERAFAKADSLNLEAGKFFNRMLGDTGYVPPLPEQPPFPGMRQATDETAGFYNKAEEYLKGAGGASIVSPVRQEAAAAAQAEGLSPNDPRYTEFIEWYVKNKAGR